MSGDPHWHVDIDIYGDDEVTFARATLTTHHSTVVGRGASRTATCLSSDRVTGDAVAVGAALNDLARRLTRSERPAEPPPAHRTTPYVERCDPCARRPA